VLVSDDDFTAEQVLADLPEPDELANSGVFNIDGTKTLHPAHAVGVTNLVWPALALEKLGQYDKALQWATKALNKDQTQGGCPAGRTHSLAHRCRGRILAAAGQMDNAREAFEAAVSCIKHRGYWLLEALALNDLNEHVLRDGSDHRLNLMLRKLVGPTESLEALMKAQPGPCDRSLAEAQVGVDVAEVEDSATAALREEVQGMQLRALQQRATAEVDDEARVDAAMDSENPKDALVALLISQYSALAATHQAETQSRRNELQQMKMSSLAKQVEEMNVEDDKIEQAMDSENPKSALVELLLLVPATKDSS
jgi:tetratricopeptide (TPR) repeat protein